MRIKEPFEGNNIWFTADSHFGHNNIISYTDRLISKFVSGNKNYLTLNQMEEVMIKHWNEVVPSTGIVFHLGDFFFMCNTIRAKEIYAQLNGTIIWVKGNHDDSKIIKALGQETYDILDIKVKDEEMDGGFQDLILCHYPLLAWDKPSKIHIHGHLHGTRLPYHSAKSIDVGVDVNHQRVKPEGSILFNARPYSYQEIKTIITNKMLNNEN